MIFFDIQRALTSRSHCCRGFIAKYQTGCGGYLPAYPKQVSNLVNVNKSTQHLKVLLWQQTLFSVKNYLCKTFIAKPCSRMNHLLNLLLGFKTIKKI